MERIEDRLEGIDGREVVAALSGAIDDLTRRVEEVEAGQVVTDDGLVLLTVEARLLRLEQQNADLLALLRSALAPDR